MKLAPHLYFLAACLVPCLVHSGVSSLWGTDGELWDPESSLLRDFTSVGYMNGDVPIPDWPVGVDVTDPAYGAIPNDDIDDTQAFLDAIAACPPDHAVYVPNGTYNIEQQIMLTNKSNFVLRGEDMYETVLLIPYYCTEIPGAQNTAIYHVASATQCGLENFSFIFRDQPKGGHWENLGADAIEYENLTHSWIRNVYIKNTDHAIALSSPWSTNVSVLNVIIDQYIGRGDSEGTARDGHMGITVFDGSYHLIDNALLTGKWHHDVNAQGGKNCVWSRITGPVLGLDHHAMGAVENLWTDIDIGRGSGWNRAASIRETYWNIRGKAQPYPSAADRNVIVGGQTSDPTDIGTDYWHETIVPEELVPQNIYLAQMEKVGKPLPATTELSLPPLEWPYRLVADDDAKVQGGNSAEENYAYEQKIQLKAGSGSTNRQGLFKYDLSGLDIANVAGAKLRVYIDGLVAPPFGMQVVGISDDNWSEETVTFNTMPASGAVLSEKMLYGGQWHTFDLTDYVNSQLIADQVVSFKLRGGAEGHNKDAFTTVISSEGGKSVELVLYMDASKADPPAAPVGLAANPGDGLVTLDWSDNAESDVSGYNLYRSIGGNSNYELRAGGLVYSEYQDRGVTNGETYYYMVKAVDSGGIESSRGNEVSALPAEPDTTPPTAPSGLEISVEGNSINLDWMSNNEADLESYRVYRRTASVADYRALADNLTESEHSDLTAEDGNLYYYALTAWDASGNESALSQRLAVKRFADSDGDGLDDAWEEQYFDTKAAIDGGLDSDGDGALDFFEFLYGSHPDDPTSSGFQLVPRRDVSASGVVFSWAVKEGYLFGSHYGVKTSTDLSAWDSPPIDGYTVHEELNSGMTVVRFQITDDVGAQLFLKLTKF